MFCEDKKKSIFQKLIFRHLTQWVIDTYTKYLVNFFNVI